MSDKALNKNAVKTLLISLKNIFTSKTDMDQVDTDTKTFVTEINYDSEIAFDTREIIKLESTVGE